MTSNWYYRILALLLAVLSWYLVTGRERVDTWVQVKIETAGLPEGMLLRGAPRDSLDVLVRGPKGLVRKLEPTGLVYTLDAKKFVPGVNTIVVEPDAIPLPKIFEVVEVRPSSLELYVERRLSKTVPVHLAFRPGAQQEYKLAGAVEPPQVTISGPEAVLRDIKDVSVQPIALPDEPSGRFDTLASLVLPDQVEASPRMVKTHVQYQLNTREVGVEVKVRPSYTGKAALTVIPDSVTLRFKAPVMLLREGGWQGLVDAYVEVDASAQPGRHDMTYRVTLPQGCELIQARPEKVSVLVK